MLNLVRELRGHLSATRDPADKGVVPKIRKDTRHSSQDNDRR